MPFFTDLEEIIQLLQDQGKSKQGGGEVVRCKKARAMFASRACRKSVMVGMPLQQSRMTAVSCSSALLHFKRVKTDWKSRS
jgi:DNA mismatch repair ATPase MutL